MTKKVKKRPPSFSRHAACCISNSLAGHHPLLMMIGGITEAKITDAWLFDVTDGSWKKVHIIVNNTRFSSMKSQCTDGHTSPHMHTGATTVLYTPLHVTTVVHA